MEEGWGSGLWGQRGPDSAVPVLPPPVALAAGWGGEWGREVGG